LRAGFPVTPKLRKIWCRSARLRAFKFLIGFDGKDARAWLLTIVRNTCYTWLRREFAKRITTKKRIARRRKTARPSTSGAVLRHADQELINRALDNCLQHRSLGYCRYGIFGCFRPQLDEFEKIENDIDKTRRRQNEFIDDTSVTRPTRLSLRTLRDSTSFAFAHAALRLNTGS
jgi:hypothetical protein